MTNEYLIEIKTDRYEDSKEVENGYDSIKQAIEYLKNTVYGDEVTLKIRKLEDKTAL